MIKKLFKNTVIYTVGDFLAVAVNGFLLLPYYTRAMSLDEFAIFSVFNASILIISFVIHFGIISTFSRHYFLYETLEERKKYIGQIIILHFAIALALIAIFLIGKNLFLKYIFSSFSNEKYYYYIIAIAFFSFMNALYSVFLRVTDKPQKFIFFQLASVGLFACLIFVFQLVQDNVLDSVTLALLVSGALMWGVSLLSLKYTFSLIGIRKTVKKTLIFATPIFMGYIMYFGLTKFNVLYLQNYTTKEELALFNFALQLSSIIAVLAASAGKAIQPALFKFKESQIIPQSIKIGLYYKLILVAILLIFVAFSKYLILLFAPPKFLESEHILHILFISTFLYNLMAIESSLFFYFNKPKITFYVTSFGAVVVVLLSMILVPNFGPIASAYSILLGSLVVLICTKYYYNVLVNGKKNEV